jgi:hypothetical protein
VLLHISGNPTNRDLAPSEPRVRTLCESFLGRELGGEQSIGAPSVPGLKTNDATDALGYLSLLRLLFSEGLANSFYSFAKRRGPLASVRCGVNQFFKAGGKLWTVGSAYLREK